jgi:hypothetical protein
VHVQIRRAIRNNLHGIIAIEDDAGYSLDLVGFDHFVFNSDTPESFEALSVDSIPALAGLAGAIPDELPALLTSISNLARTLVPRFHPNMFHDFILSFIRTTAADCKALAMKNENVGRALKFLADLKEERRHVDQRIGSLLPTLQKLQIDSESLQSSYTTRKEAIETRKQKLTEDHKAKVEEVKGLEVEVAQLEKDRKEWIPKSERAIREVEKLTDNDIETIRITAADPLPSLRLLMELFCLFLDLPQSYDRSGQKLLMDKKFVPTLVTRVSTSGMGPSLLATAYEYLDSPELDAAELESIAPALKILYDWVASLCRVASVRETLMMKKKMLDEKRRTLEDFSEEMQLEITSIEQVEQSLVLEKEELSKSQAAREKLELEYKDVDVRKRALDSLFTNIDLLIEKWEKDSSSFEARRDQSLGDSLLFSFYLVFCGLMSDENRLKGMDETRKLIVDSGLSANSEARQVIRDRFLFSNTDEQSGEAISAQIDAQHIRSTFRCPLLIDPDGIVTSLISTSVKQKKLLMISQGCSHLEGLIASAMTDGKTLVLIDADSLNPIVATILPLSLMSSDPTTSNEIRVGSKLATWDRKFKLILVTSTPIDQLPDDLLARVTAVDVSYSSLAATQSALTRTFIEFFAPELSPRLSEVQKQDINKRVQIDRYEREVLTILVDIVATRSTRPEYDCLADSEIMKDLVKSKDNYIQQLNAPTTNSQLVEEVKSTVKPFKQHITLCHTFWRGMSRELPLINSSSTFVFANYQKAIAAVFLNDGLHPGSLSGEQHSALRQSLTSVSFQFVFQSLPLRDAMFFMFYIGCQTKKSIKMRSTQRSIKDVFDHVRDEFTQTCDFQTSESTSGDALEHLRFTNLINVFQFFHQFLLNQFGQDYTTFLPHFQVDSLITTSASIPSIVLSSPEVNPTALVQHFIGLRCRIENLDCLSLSDDLEDIRNNRKVVQAAMSRGNWVIIHYSKPCVSAASMLTDVFTQMTTTSLNTNFRLIVIAISTEYLPRSMLARSKRVNVESFPTVRNTMLRLFHHHSVSIRSTTNSRAMKKLSYISAILMSIISFRNTLEPIGFSTGVQTNALIFKDMIDQLQIIIDANPNDIPLRNLRTQIERVVYSGISDEIDRRRIAAHLATVIVPDCLEDGFSAASRSDDRDRFVVPGDVPLSNFTQIIQQLPLFPATDVLRMNGDEFRSMNLSMWISRAFVEYDRTVKPIDWHSLSFRIENLMTLLPQNVPIADPSLMRGNVGLFLLSEVAILNDILQYIREDVELLESNCNKRIADSVVIHISQNQFPEKWRIRTKLWTLRKLSSFTAHIIERHAQLMRCVQEGSPVVFDMRLVENPRFLLEAFLTDTTTEMNVGVGHGHYEFAIFDSIADIEPHCLFLTRTSLACCDVSDGSLTLKGESKTGPVKVVASVTAKVVAKTKAHLKCFGLPFFKQGLVGTQADGRVTDGRSDNFIWEIELPVEGNEMAFDLTGAAMFCRITDQLI